MRRLHIGAGGSVSRGGLTGEEQLVERHDSISVRFRWLVAIAVVWSLACGGVAGAEVRPFVTDSFQATIWRVPPGGGAPQIWFQDARLASPSFGPNGIRIDPTGTKVYFTVTEDFQQRGFVYTLPLVAQPAAGQLQVFHQYTNGDLPDGIAFGKTGRLYVAIATPFASGISILSPAGAEVIRLSNQGNPIFPYDSPANIAFDGKGSILVTNHAFVTGVTNPAQFTILDVWVNDPGSPLHRPFISLTTAQGSAHGSGGVHVSA